MFAPTEAQLKQLLSSIPLNSTWGKRNYLMICFLCHTGMRIGEMTKLEVHHVTHQGEPRDEVYLTHKLVTKTRHGRVVPLNSVARECITKLLEFNRMRGFSTEERAPLFPWKNHGFLPVREAEREIQRLRERAGLSAKITPHTFRHFFATRISERGVSQPVLKSLLVHRASRSTEIYAHSSAQREREAVDMLPQSRSVRGVGA